jgi:hypothetical protein
MMDRMRPVTTIVLGLLLPLTVACQPKTVKEPQQGSEPAITVLYAGQHCGRAQTAPSATWIDDARQLEISIKRIQETMLGSKPLLLPELDFQHEIALLVEMGQRSTLGYHIALTGADDLRITRGLARLTLDWVQPPAGVMVAQMISSPCLLLKLGRGDYTSVQILDKQGASRADTH